MQSLVTLVVDDNEVEGVFGDELRALPQLRSVSLCRNQITTVRGLAGLVGLGSLKELLLEGNPVLESPEFAAFATSTGLPAPANASA